MHTCFGTYVCTPKAPPLFDVPRTSDHHLRPYFVFQRWVAIDFAVVENNNLAIPAGGLGGVNGYPLSAGRLRKHLIYVCENPVLAAHLLPCSCHVGQGIWPAPQLQLCLAALARYVLFVQVLATLTCFSCYSVQDCVTCRQLF
jgi:hypothetical protein